MTSNIDDNLKQTNKYRCLVCGGEEFETNDDGSISCCMCASTFYRANNGKLIHYSCPLCGVELEKNVDGSLSCCLEHKFYEVDDDKFVGYSCLVCGSGDYKKSNDGTLTCQACLSTDFTSHIYVPHIYDFSVDLPDFEDAQQTQEQYNAFEVFQEPTKEINQLQKFKLKIFHCPMCGAKEYENTSDNKIACLYCGVKYIDVKELPFERELAIAENHRQLADFEKARNTYKKILAERSYANENLTSVYWGLFLCDNNVVFEKDSCNKIFPSFYRVQRRSCYDNPNYQVAKELCEKFQPDNLKNMNDLAEKIEYARKMYCDIAEKEKSFDIFICFKNDNAESTRTAEKLYYKLNDKKYNIFFSNETLLYLKTKYRDYEPNIYHALYTAKVMLLICKSQEDLESQWVKNEWSRFLELNKRLGKEKPIIPIFLDGFKPEDLPDPLFHMQGLFTADFGMLSNLEKQLEHYIKIEQQGSTTMQDSTTNITTSLNQMWVNIRLKQDFVKAKELAMKVLELDIECSSAWLGLAFCDYKVATEEDLAKNDNYLDNTNIKYAIRYAKDKEKANLDQIHQLYLKNKQQRHVEPKSGGNGLKNISKGDMLRMQAAAIEEAKKKFYKEHGLDQGIIKFGLYPQTKVVDKDILKALGGFDENTWISYKYYVESKVCDYMFYIDKVYNGNKYRGVYFVDYRPYDLTNKSKENWQKDNGYKKKTVYWFKYEPIQWKVVKEESQHATLVSNIILDCRQFDIKDNNYQNSQIRAWLNNEFYNNSFDDKEQSIILTSLIDNSANSAGFAKSISACPDTKDKIYLLAYNELKVYFDKNESRRKVCSDYTKCQGLLVNERTESSSWWLRSPFNNGSEHVRGILGGGGLDYVANNLTNGVVPVLNVKIW